MSTGGGGYSRKGRNTQPKATMPFAARSSEHPPPPAELDEEEAEIWHGIVDRMPGDYFASPTFPMLVNLCRHIRQSRLFARQLREYEVQLLRAFDDKLLRIIMTLSRAQANESRTIAMLCTRLKLTQLYDASSIHKARRAFLTEQRPWDVPPDEEDEDLPQ